MFEKRKMAVGLEGGRFEKRDGGMF